MISVALWYAPTIQPGNFILTEECQKLKRCTDFHHRSTFLSTSLTAPGPDDHIRLSNRTPSCNGTLRATISPCAMSLVFSPLSVASTDLNQAEDFAPVRFSSVSFRTRHLSKFIQRGKRKREDSMHSEKLISKRVSHPLFFSRFVFLSGFLRVHTTAHLPADALLPVTPMDFTTQRNRVQTKLLAETLAGFIKHGPSEKATGSFSPLP